jgi:hypothetical protein
MYNIIFVRKRMSCTCLNCLGILIWTDRVIRIKINLIIQSPQWSSYSVKKNLPMGLRYCQSASSSNLPLDLM